MLQTRSAKRTARAAVKIATDMVREKAHQQGRGAQRVDPMHVEQLLLPRFDEARSRRRKAGRFLAKGLNASPGAATGRAVFDADRAVELKGRSSWSCSCGPRRVPTTSTG
jgi:pyruvate,orthophosphate dikinase